MKRSTHLLKGGPSSGSSGGPHGLAQSTTTIAIGTFDDRAIPRGERRTYSFTVAEGGTIEPGPEFNAGNGTIDGRQARGKIWGPGGYDDFEVTGDIVSYDLPAELAFHGGAPATANDSGGNGSGGNGSGSNGNGSGGGGSGANDYGEGYGETIPTRAIPVLDAVSDGFVVEPPPSVSLAGALPPGTQVALLTPKDDYGQYTVQGIQPTNQGKKVIVTEPAPDNIGSQAVTYAPQIHLVPAGGQGGGGGGGANGNGRLISGVPNSTLYIGSGIIAAASVAALAMGGDGQRR